MLGPEEGLDLSEEEEEERNGIKDRKRREGEEGSSLNDLKRRARCRMAV